MSEKLRKLFGYTFKNHRAIIGILAVAFLLRLFRIGFHEFWYDEIYSIRFARAPWDNWNAPLYWILLHMWIKIFPITEAALRFPSLLFSLFTVKLVYLLGRGLFNKRTALFASLFIALSPFQIWYAQEARDYSMALFLGALSSYLLFLAIKREKSNLWLFFILSVIAALYTNYFFIFLLTAQFIYLVFKKKENMNYKIFITFFVILFAFSFYLPRLFNKFIYVSGGFWLVKPTWQSLLIILQNFIVGYNGDGFLHIALVFFFALFLAPALFLLRKEKRAGEGVAFCAFLCFIPISAIFIFSKLFFPIFLNRALIIFSPFFYILLAAGLDIYPKKTKLVLCVLFIVIFLSAGHRYFNNKVHSLLAYHEGVHAKKPVKPIVDFLKQAAGKQDIVAFTFTDVIPSVGYYSKKTLPDFYFLFAPGLQNPNWKRPFQEGSIFIPVHTINSINFNKAFVIASCWGRQGWLDENSTEVKKWLDANLNLIGTREFDGLWIFIYERRVS